MTRLAGLLIGMAAAAVTLAAPTQAVVFLPANVLANGGFEQGSFTAVSSTGYRTLGGSAASDWQVWNSSYSTTTSQLTSPSTDPLAGGAMLSLSTAADYSGVFQVASSFRFASVDIKVLSGNVFVGLYRDGGSTEVASAFTSSGDWQHLTFDTGASNYADEMVIYGMGSSSFQVDNAYAGAVAQPVPEPGEWAMLGAGLGVAGLVARRRRRA